MLNNKMCITIISFLISINLPVHAINLLYSEWGTGDIGIVNSTGNSSKYATTTGLQNGSLIADNSGNLYISDSSNQQILKVSSSNRATSVYASGPSFSNPTGLALDDLGNLFVSNYAWTGGTTVLKVNPSGNVTTFANVSGGGSLSYKQSTGDLYLGVYYSSQINSIDTNGNVSLFKTGSGTGYANTLTFDSLGNLYVGTQGYGGATPVINKVTSDGTTTLFWSSGGYTGAYLNAVAYDPIGGDLYAAYGTSVLKIDALGSSTVFASNLTTGNISGLAIIPSSTAVPEPGTFLPAALLVMGALLRRRRPRSHRSVRATA